MVLAEIAGGSPEGNQPFDFHALRNTFKGAWIVNNGYNREMATDAISSGYADLVTFGKPFSANPDLVEGFKTHSVLNPIDPSTFYGGGARGYTDYPTLK